MSQEQQPFEGEAEATMPHICTELSPRVVEAAQALGRKLAAFPAPTLLSEGAGPRADVEEAMNLLLNVLVDSGTVPKELVCHVRDQIRVGKRGLVPA